MPRVSPPSRSPRSRASATPVAVVLLVGIAVVLAAGIGAALSGPGLQEPPRHVSIQGEVTADGTVTLEHAGGPTLDVERLTIHVTVDGTPLTYQPPVPFFSARGFYPGPTGPFNSASDPEWAVGGIASFRIAGSNDPPLRHGHEVVVRVIEDDQVLASVEVRARTS